MLVFALMGEISAPMATEFTEFTGPKQRRGAVYRGVPPQETPPPQDIVCNDVITQQNIDQLITKVKKFYEDLRSTRRTTTGIYRYTSTPKLDPNGNNVFDERGKKVFISMLDQELEKLKDSLAKLMEEGKTFKDFWKTEEARKLSGTDTFASTVRLYSGGCLL